MHFLLFFFSKYATGVVIFNFCVQLEFALLQVPEFSDVFFPHGILKVITAQEHNTLFSGFLKHAFWTRSASVCLLMMRSHDGRHCFLDEHGQVRKSDQILRRKILQSGHAQDSTFDPENLYSFSTSVVSELQAMEVISSCVSGLRFASSWP